MTMDNQLDEAGAEQLFRAIASLDSADECRAFLRDLCTLKELESMIERYRVAKLFRKGLSYRQISEQLGSSTATVTRVAYWYKHGTGGYAAVIDKMDELETNTAKQANGE